MVFTVSQLRWLRDHYIKEKNSTEVDDIDRSYADELKLEDHDIVVFLWRHNEPYMRCLKRHNIKPSRRVASDTRLPATLDFSALPTPTRRPEAEMKKWEGNWPAHVPSISQCPFPDDSDLPPGDNFDLAMARTIMMREDCPNITLPAYSFITAAYRQETSEREREDRERVERKEKTFGGPLKLVSEFEKDANVEWIRNPATADTWMVGSMYGSHLRRVDGTAAVRAEELNDVVLNGFMVLAGRAMEHKKKKSWVIDPGFSTVAGGDDQEKLDRWAKRAQVHKHNYEHYDAMILPYCTLGHWILVIAEPRTKSIMTWDAARTTARSEVERIAFGNMQRFLARVTGHKNWTHSVRKTPQQRDSVSCGVIVCYAAACYVLRGGDSAVDSVDAATSREMRDLLLLIFREGELTEKHAKRLK